MEPEMEISFTFSSPYFSFNMGPAAAKIAFSYSKEKFSSKPGRFERVEPGFSSSLSRRIIILSNFIL